MLSAYEVLIVTLASLAPIPLLTAAVALILHLHLSRSRLDGDVTPSGPSGPFPCPAMERWSSTMVFTLGPALFPPEPDRDHLNRSKMLPLAGTWLAFS